MYWLKLLNNETKKEVQFNFDTLNDAKLFKEYHVRFEGIDKKVDVWIHEKFVLETQRHLIVDKTEKELQKNIVSIFYKLSPKYTILEDNLGISSAASKKDLFLHLRNLALKECDWTQLADVKLGTEEKKLWRGYREYLRNLPSLHNDETIGNARICSFEEWKEGKR